MINIKMCKRILLKINGEFEKLILFLISFGRRYHNYF